MAKKASVKPEASTVVNSASSAPAAAPAKKTRTPRTKAASAPTDGTRKPAPRSSAKRAADGTTTSHAVVIDLGREDVARLAYSYWEARGYQGGSPVEDWLRAEEELRERVPALNN
jgi:hypothetical protein